MNDKDTISYIFTIHLVDGDPLKFNLDARETELKLNAINDDLERALNRNAMAIESDHTLLIIPYSSIKYIECNPSPPDLPITILRGAKRLFD